MQCQVLYSAITTVILQAHTFRDSAHTYTHRPLTFQFLSTYLYAVNISS